MTSPPTQESVSAFDKMQLTGKFRKGERPHIGRCVRATGSPVSGILLYRLIFWTPTIMIGNRAWFAKSTKDLMFETGLSSRQVKDGLRQLRDHGYIDTRRGFFGNKNVNHFLVEDEAISALLAVKNDDE